MAVPVWWKVVWTRPVRGLTAAGRASTYVLLSFVSVRYSSTDAGRSWWGASSQERLLVGGVAGALGRALGPLAPEQRRGARASRRGSARGAAVRADVELLARRARGSRASAAAARCSRSFEMVASSSDVEPDAVVLHAREHGHQRHLDVAEQRARRSCSASSGSMWCLQAQGDVGVLAGVVRRPRATGTSAIVIWLLPLPIRSEVGILRMPSRRIAISSRLWTRPPGSTHQSATMVSKATPCTSTPWHASTCRSYLMFWPHFGMAGSSSTGRSASRTASVSRPGPAAEEPPVARRATVSGPWPREKTGGSRLQGTYQASRSSHAKERPDEVGAHRVDGRWSPCRGRSRSSSPWPAGPSRAPRAPSSCPRCGSGRRRGPTRRRRPRAPRAAP